MDKNCQQMQQRNTKKKSLNQAKEISPSSTSSCLDEGQCLRERWTVKGSVGSGGFGQIFCAFDDILKDDVVIKAAARRRLKDTARMVLETKVLLSAREKRLVNFPQLLGSGQEPHPVAKVNFIVMQLLSENLTDLRRNLLKRHRVRTPQLSLGCVLRCAHQAISGLRDMHSLGYLHRDVKPSNMAFGVTPDTSRILYLIDFGLVRQYTDANGVPLPERTAHVGYRGTARYSSVRVHQRYDQCRADDLMSVWYSMMESLNGELPWRNVKEPHLADLKLEHQEDERKYNSFVRLCPDQLKAVELHIRALDFSDSPPYNTMLQLIETCLNERGIRMNEPYDWENDYANCPGVAQTY